MLHFPTSCLAVLTASFSHLMTMPICHTEEALRVAKPMPKLSKNNFSAVPHSFPCIAPFIVPLRPSRAPSLSTAVRCYSTDLTLESPPQDGDPKIFINFYEDLKCSFLRTEWTPLHTRVSNFVSPSSSTSKTLPCLSQPGSRLLLSRRRRQNQYRFPPFPSRLSTAR